MINDLMNIGHVVGQDGHRQPQKAVERLSMSRRRDKPRQLEDDQLEELSLVIFMNDFGERVEENLNPDAQILSALILRIHETLLIYHIIKFLHVALYY
jgi:hypothetical protein